MNESTVNTIYVDREDAQQKSGAAHSHSVTATADINLTPEEVAKLAEGKAIVIEANVEDAKELK